MVLVGGVTDPLLLVSISTAWTSRCLLANTPDVNGFTFGVDRDALLSSLCRANLQQRYIESVCMWNNEDVCVSRRRPSAGTHRSFGSQEQ